LKAKVACERCQKPIDWNNILEAYGGLKNLDNLTD